jgi:cytoskeletal protein CcmA (bactofilin family)
MFKNIAIPTLIAEGTLLQGSFSFLNRVEIFGTIEGDIEQQSLESLKIGKRGFMNGSITSKGPIYIEGKVKGNLTSQTKVHLSATADVVGKIKSPQVIIKSGAIFQGETLMSDSESKKDIIKKAA